MFGQNGIAATSVRQITAAAGVNVASVHYHFGSRAGLIAALFERRLGPMNERRLAALDRLEQEFGGETIPIERLLRTFLRPSFDLARSPGGEQFVRLLGTYHLDSDPTVDEIIEQQFSELKRRFLPVMQAALPHLSASQIFWRMQFVLGATARTLAGGEGLENKSSRTGRC